MGIEKYQRHLGAQVGAQGGAAEGHPQGAASAASPQASLRSDGELPLQFLEDISLEVQVALGRVSLSVQNILGLKEGSIIELEREPDSTCDVLINGNHVARGEVVVVNDHYGIRVTSVKEPHFFTESDGEYS